MPLSLTTSAPPQGASGIDEDANNVRDPNAKRIFSLEEIRPSAGQGTYTETLSRFEWDAKTKSAPRHGWEYGVVLRTNREDYPGSDEPVEQVLGAHYEPQNFRGVWDDRWAGAGFAENQRIEFEKMVQRGNYVRISFETITFTGIITGFKPTYFTSFRIGYEFNFSPHYRVQGGDTRRGRILAPKTADPVEHLLKVDTIVNDAKAALERSPKPHVTQDLVSVVAAALGVWADRADTINAVIDGRVLAPSGEGPNSVARVVQGFQSMAASALALLPTLAPVRTDLNLDFEAAIAVLAFDESMREVAFQARSLIVECYKASADLSKLFDPQARAIYRPRAGESLYGISNRFYGTPHRWRAIADRNKLRGFTLSGGEVLVIPDVSGKVSGI